MNKETLQKGNQIVDAQFNLEEFSKKISDSKAGNNIVKIRLYWDHGNSVEIELKEPLGINTAAINKAKNDDLLAIIDNLSIHIYFYRKCIFSKRNNSFINYEIPWKKEITSRI